MKFTAIATSALLVALAAATETSYDEELGCWPISVEHDATYCIDGPICSGSGAQPAGWKCPVAGDVAIADCHSYLVSYTGGDDCVLPVDTTCQVIKTGAWGCVLTGSTPSPTSTGGGATPAPTSVGGGGSTPTSNPSTPTSNPSTPTSNPTTPTTSPKTPTPTPTHGPSPSGSGSGDVEPGSGESDEDISFSSVMTASSAGSVSAGAIAAIAAAAAAVCAAVGTVLYKKYHQRTPAQDTHNTMLEVVTP